LSLAWYVTRGLFASAITILAQDRPDGSPAAILRRVKRTHVSVDIVVWDSGIQAAFVC
jgi:hypothetical protein